MVDSDFVTDLEIDDMMTAAISELWDVVASAYGDEYLARDMWINVGPGTDPLVTWPSFTYEEGNAGYRTMFPLNYTQRKIVRVAFTPGIYSASGSGGFKLDRVPERMYPMHRLDIAGQIVDMRPREWTQTRVAYRVRQVKIPYLSGASAAFWYGPVIEFLPPASTACAVQVIFVPAPDVWALDETDVADDQFEFPFEQFVVYYAAAMCLEKQQSDSSVMRALQTTIERQIRENARTADAANPPKVVRRYGNNRLLYDYEDELL